MPYPSGTRYFPGGLADRRRAAFLMKLGISVILIAGTGLLVWSLRGSSAETSTPPPSRGATKAGSTMRWNVQRQDLTISALASGEMKTKSTTQVRNDASTSQQLKITWIIPEGTQVKAGDKLVELDSTQIKENYLQQKIKLSEAEEKLQQAKDNMAIAETQSLSDKLAGENLVQIAKLDLKKYEEGDFQQDKRKKESAVRIAEEELKRAQDRLEWTQRLFEKEYVTDNDLQADKLAVIKCRINVETAQEDLRLLERFSYERETTKFRTALIEAQGKLSEKLLTWERDINSRRATAETAEERRKLEAETTKNLEEQLSASVIRAPADGMVVYYKDRGRFGSQESVVQVGSSVYARQRLIDLPDFSSWIIEARVHESLIQQIKLGQRAFITMDAFPDKVLSGTVAKVSVLPDNSQWFRDTQEYLVEIDLDQKKDTFKPGMSGKTEIIINELKGVLAVPVQAVSVKDGKTVVNVAAERGTELVEVEIGKSNDRFVEIVKGLTEGQEVLLQQAESRKSSLGPRPSEQASADDRKVAGDAATAAAKAGSGRGNGGGRRNRAAEGAGQEGASAPAAGGEGAPPPAAGGDAVGGAPRTRMDPSTMTPEQREEMKKRAEEMLKNASPEDRAKIEARIKRFTEQGSGGGAPQP